MDSNNLSIPNLNTNGNESRVGYKRSVSRSNSGYVSSIMGECCISCTTFNILAPIYKRLDHQVSSYICLVPFYYHYYYKFLLADSFFFFLVGNEIESKSS